MVNLLLYFDTFPKKQTGNEKPRVFRLLEDEAIINHLGFNNKGSERILSNLKSSIVADEPESDFEE